MPSQFINASKDWSAKALKPRFTVEAKLPALKAYSDVVALPTADALYRSDGTRIDDSKRVNLPPGAGTPATIARILEDDAKSEPARIVVPSNLRSARGKMLYVGAMWPHYGHFLTDGMARLWALDERPGLPVLMLDRAARKMWKLPYVRSVLEANGITRERLVRVREPTIFRKVLIPSPSILHTVRIHDCHDRGHLKTAARIVGRSTDRWDKVYLSRSQLKDRLRKSQNEDVLEARLGKEGFTVVAPERLSFEDQVEIFNSARWIVGTAGSAFHTVLFSARPPKPTLVQLCWEGKVNARYLMIDAIKGCDSAYISCSTIDEIKPDSRIAKTTIDIEHAMDAIASLGALSR